jgi:hypothetical protein
MPVIGGQSTPKPKKAPVKVVIKDPTANTAENAAANYNDPNENTGAWNLQKTGPGTNYKNVSSTSFDNPTKPGGGTKKTSSGTSGTAGPWESGTNVGKWEAGATGRWEQRSFNKDSVGGGGGTPHHGIHEGNMNSIMDVQRIRDRNGTSGVFDPYGMESGAGGESGGGAGGGGTGSPLLGVSSALKATGLKSTANIAGKSVEEVTSAKGARRTKKSGQKRSQ